MRRRKSRSSKTTTKKEGPTHHFKKKKGKYRGKKKTFWILLHKGERAGENNHSTRDRCKITQNAREARKGKKQH